MNNNYDDRAGKQLNFFLRMDYTAFVFFVKRLLKLNCGVGWR